jgi:hypothetical protein
MSKRKPRREEEDEEVLVELGAADVPGKSIRGMAWNVATVRGFLTADSVIWVSAAGPELRVRVVDDVSSTGVRYKIVSTLFFCRSIALRSQ